MTKKLLTILSAFGALVLAVFFISNPLTGEEHSELLRFIGRFHPVVLHLPIGFFVILGILELGALFAVTSKLKASIPIVLVLTILATLFAVFTGLLLAYSSGSNEPLVIFHMRASLLLGILILAMGVLKLHSQKLATALAYKITLVATLVLLFVTSHNGGSITHGEDYLTKYMPNNMRSLFGLEVVEKKFVASVDDLVVYADLIHPILEQNCITCHNPDKLKGELNLETIAGLLKGGEMGYAIAAGNLDDSELYFRITLPYDDEDFMPSEGKPPLSDTEVAVIAWWIEEGADAELTVAAYKNIPPLVEAYSQKIFGSMVSDEDLEKREQERLQLYSQLADVHKNLGILILPTEPKSSHFSVETFAVQKTFDDEALAQLEPFAHTIVEADFSSTQLTDQALLTLAKFENLRTLNLSKTQIAGQNIANLAQLEHLESLNLYGTPLTTETVAELSQFTQLKNLYLFQTDLYEDSIIAQLKEALPECNFVLN
ncbi:MAG: hypothetical protein O7C75_14000 [Verrucomicrobia bacterium]|nr:hypothetical protein [Verrucomicrobiota bacterium]